jgi:hypothetical protein
MNEANEIRIVVFAEGDYWVAQCLEYDIGAQAKDLHELTVRLDLTIEAERRESLERHGSEFAGIDPAPAAYQEMWGRRTGFYKPLAGLERCDLALVA